ANAAAGQAQRRARRPGAGLDRALVNVVIQVAPKIGVEAPAEVVDADGTAAARALQLLVAVPDIAVRQAAVERLVLLLQHLTFREGVRVGRAWTGHDGFLQT